MTDEYNRRNVLVSFPSMVKESSEEIGVFGGGGAVGRVEDDELFVGSA